MDESSALLKLLGIGIVVAVWAYANFSNHPDIVKQRSTTQKWINTAVALVVLFWIISGID